MAVCIVFGCLAIPLERAVQFHAPLYLHKVTLTVFWNWGQQNISFNMKKILKYGFIAFGVLFLFALVKTCITGEYKNRTTSTIKPEEKYPVYTQWQKEATSKLSEEVKKNRQEFLDGMTKTITYDSIVNSKKVSVEYIPVINAIANGITYLKADLGFSVEQHLLDDIRKTENGEDKVTFALNCIALSQTKKGGITPEVIETFERYRTKFKLYGQPSTLYDGNGTMTKNTNTYDFTPIFAMLDPQNEDFIEAIYEAKEKGITNWRDNTEGLMYPFISNSKEYTKKLLSVKPNSKILPKGINDDFWTKYDPIVKERALDLYIRKDCKGLQEEFNTTADNFDRLNKARKDGSRNIEHMDFLDNALKKLDCY